MSLFNLSEEMAQQQIIFISHWKIKVFYWSVILCILNQLLDGGVNVVVRTVQNLWGLLHSQARIAIEIPHEAGQVIPEAIDTDGDVGDLVEVVVNQFVVPRLLLQLQQRQFLKLGQPIVIVNNFVWLLGGSDTHTVQGVGGFASTVVVAEVISLIVRGLLLLVHVHLFPLHDTTWSPH